MLRDQASGNHVRLFHRLQKVHAPVLQRSFAFPPLRWFWKLSCDERP